MVLISGINRQQFNQHQHQLLNWENMSKFKEWILKRDQALYENMWGNIPCKGRKPSDGRGGRGGSMGGGMMQQQQPMQQKMKKK